MPTEEALGFVSAPKARAYIRALPAAPRPDWGRLFPGAAPAAVDLVARMLAFDPRARITVGEALRHPWLAGLHDPAAEPAAPAQFRFDFEEQKLDEPAVRRLVAEEMEAYAAAGAAEAAARKAAPGAAA
jgi:hypothetical protein